MKKFIIALLLLVSSTYTVAEIVIIGNLENNQQTLTALQVKDIFMGRTRAFPNGEFASPYDQLGLRTKFYQSLTNRPIEQINAYWARLMFSGQTSPPKKLADDESIIKKVQENKGAIGYINKENLNEKKVRVFYQF